MAKKRGNPAFQKGVPNPYRVGKGKKQVDKAKELSKSSNEIIQNQVLPPLINQSGSVPPVEEATQ